MKRIEAIEAILKFTGQSPALAGTIDKAFAAMGTRDTIPDGKLKSILRLGSELKDKGVKC